MVEVIRPKSPFGEGQPYSFLPVDLHALLLLLMIGLTDSSDDDGLVDDFCACFHLSKKAVLAAVRVYRHARLRCNLRAREGLIDNFPRLSRRP
jgi:hypothetical protein